MRVSSYRTVTGEIRLKRVAKPGPKPLPLKYRRSKRVIASVYPSLRDALDYEIIDTGLTESDIASWALREWIANRNQERILCGLLHSSLLKS